MKNFRGTEAVINLSHLLHNYHQLKSLHPSQKFICPMVKANAYGHGDGVVALSLEKAGVKMMGVGLVEEGISLREKGVKVQLLVYGVFDKTAIDEVKKYQLTPVVSTWSELHLLGKELPGISIHIKFDTGMHRLGFLPEEAVTVLEYAKNKFKIEGVLTHLHSAEDLLSSDASAWQQLDRFGEIIKKFPPHTLIHTLNSAGALNTEIALRLGKSPHALARGVRPGTALYGYSPVDFSPLDFELKPVMSFRSRVIRFHHLKVGDSVSYSATWRASRPSVIGVVPVGYADGYRRGLSNRGKVIFLEQKVPVVGNVCMDYVMIDVTDALKGQNLDGVDAEVTLFGESSKGQLMLASDLAEVSQTITWDILTSISDRVPRRVVL